MLLPGQTLQSKYILTPHCCMAPISYGNEQSGRWLDTAIPLDAYLVSDAPDVASIANLLLEEVIINIEANGAAIKTRSKLAYPHLKQTVQAILLNLYFAYLLGVPVRLYRSKNRYVKKARYGKLFFEYKRVIATVDTLLRLNLIYYKKGHHFKGKKEAQKTSRIWATTDLIRLFHKVNVHQPRRIHFSPRPEVIELRDKDKRPEYTDDKNTRRMRKNLVCYNNFIGQQKIEVQVDGAAPINLNQLSERIYRNLLSGDLTLTNLLVDKYSMTGMWPVVTDLYSSNDIITSNNNIIYKSSVSSNKSSITDTIFDYTRIINGLMENKPLWRSGPEYSSTATTIPGENEAFLPLLKVLIRRHYQTNRCYADKAYADEKYARWYYKKLNTEKRSLGCFGIRQVGFTINNTNLFRVFNRSDFGKGGRFYGSYQTLPKGFRPSIKINNEPTAEPDYSAHHIRISYHLEGIDYREDPYLAMTDNPDERTVFKLLLLVLMNAETESSSIAGFRNSNRDKLKRLLGDLKSTTILPLIERVKKAHPRIAHYIHSNAGVTLQNIDSKITEGILMEMTAQEIPCLPIHDSYIVPAQHEGQLQGAMACEYKKVMGFEPVID